MNPPAASPAGRILLASLAGTTIEYFDFYIYATAAVVAFPALFFPTGDAQTARLQSLATFALAFVARPIGSALFGHFGDRIGRKATLVAALLTMGGSTVAIGLLPSYAAIGIAAPALLCLLRLGQGLGLGGEWGGAMLLATENAPPGRESIYGMFPQLGSPLGFLLASGIFVLLSAWLPETAFLAWGWRIPFLASAALVLVGLYVRLRIAETPQFLRAMSLHQRVPVPVLHVCREHLRTLIIATFIATTTFVTFYLMTVFSLSWATTRLGYPRSQFLLLQMIGVLFFALTIPLSAYLAQRTSGRAVLIAASIAIALFGLTFGALFGTHSTQQALLYLCVGLALMGVTYGPLGTVLAGLFPTPVRYTGSSLAFSLAGIVGGSAAPYLATWLAGRFGVAFVGYYLSAAALVTLVALLLVRPLRAAQGVSAMLRAPSGVDRHLP
ncbi:MAG TPA: MFS transporter [Steroidobacteraceae bacterium]|nr:MFS transporter [Steroidobacteraceae bacterium]